MGLVCHWSHRIGIRLARLMRSNLKGGADGIYTQLSSTWTECG